MARGSILLLTLTLCFAAGSKAQATYTTGFEPPQFILGDVNGQDGWGHLSNSPTDGFIEPVPANPPGAFGAQSLAIRTRNVDFFGVANHLYSATIDPAAGETGSTAVTPVADPQSHFSASFWFHTPAQPVASTRSDGRFAELNPSSKGSGADDPANRYAQIRLFNDPLDPTGLVRVEIGWYTSSGFMVATVAHLAWNEWYRFDILIHLVDGLDGVEPNDRFTLTVYDRDGTPIGSACGSTWEQPYKTGAFGGGTTPRAINGFDFWSVSGPNGNLAGHLDELTMTAFTPATTLTAAITGNPSACAGGTTTLTASTTTGGAPITSYTWRDATNAVVSTTSTLDAAPGTYTLTITDALCDTATSTPFEVTADAPLTVAITGSPTAPFGGTTSLTADVAGGSGTITTYTWRDATNAVVGTASTFDAGPGTYTVTIEDASCGSATSPPFTVIAAAAPAAVPAAGDAALAMIVLALGWIAITRLR